MKKNEVFKYWIQVIIIFDEFNYDVLKIASEVRIKILSEEVN